MKTGFKDPIAPKIKAKSRNSPWNFECPQYDERTSCYVNAGTHYGTGYNQPIGHSGNPKTTADVLPKGRVNTLGLYNDGKKSEIL